MRIAVIKFGGASLASHDLRQIAALRVREAIEEGFQPVVVVSAFGRRGDPYATDTLVDLALKNYAALLPREWALLASCGELIAAVVMTSLLCREGLAAMSLTGGQAGVITTNGFTGTHIASVDPTSLLAILQSGSIPVVTGFQGRSTAGEICVLERGGSDISSAAIGCALGAEIVHLFKETPGVHTADPVIVPEAKLIRRLNYKGALCMALHGAKIIHPDAVTWAMRGAIPIRVRSLLEPTRSTLITGYPDGQGGCPVSITASSISKGDLTMVSVINVPEGEEAAFGEIVDKALRESNISVVELASGLGAVSATVEGRHSDMAQVVLHDRLVVQQPGVISRRKQQRIAVCL